MPSPDRREENLKKFLHITLSYAELVGFMLPAKGGLALSLGSAGVDSLISLFFNGGQSEQVRAMVSIGNAVVKAMSAMAKHVEEAVWRGFQSEHLAAVQSAADSLHGLFADMLDGKVTAEKMDPVFLKDWEQRFSEGKRMCGPGSPLLKAIAWIELASNDGHAHQLTPTYLMTTSLYLNFCKLSLIVEQVELERAYRAALAEWKREHADGKDDGTKPRAPEMNPLTYKQSPYWRDLRSHVHEWVPVARSRIDDIKAAFIRLEEATKSRAREFAVVQEGNGWYYEDKHMEYRSRRFSSHDAANLAMLTVRGEAVTKVREALLDQLELRSIDPNITPMLEEIMTQLEKAKEIYN